jgi:hypothetical protein
VKRTRSEVVWARELVGGGKRLIVVGGSTWLLQGLDCGKVGEVGTKKVRGAATVVRWKQCVRQYNTTVPGHAACGCCVGRRQEHISGHAGPYCASSSSSSSGGGGRREQSVVRVCLRHLQTWTPYPPPLARVGRSSQRCVLVSPHFLSIGLGCESGSVETHQLQ